MRVILVPATLCDWREAGRLLGRATLDLREDAGTAIERWAANLNNARVGHVYCGEDALSREIGQRLSVRLGIVPKAVDELDEVDLGLWTGLTDEQLRARFASAHRQLEEAPLTVVPPEGESLAAAAARVSGEIRRRIRRNGKSAIAFVLRPIALALAVRACGSADDDVWALSRSVEAPVELVPDGARLAVDA